jgi:hypothetical protein
MMPTRDRTVQDAISIFNNARYPQGLSVETAWLGIYQALLWYEEINWAGYSRLPHIIDADKLRPSASRQKSLTSLQPSVWQRRAAAVEEYLAKQLDCPVSEVVTYVDQLLHLPDYIGLQRQNPLGTAFAGVVKHILERFGNPAIAYELEVEATSVFPGIAFPGRSSTPSIDILARRSNLPRVVISVKWSLRHDRINDITNECPIYKAAALWSHTPFDFYVVTNEYDPARLEKILRDTCVNGLVHVHAPAVTHICDLDGRLGQMLDLSNLVEITYTWT